MSAAPGRPKQVNVLAGNTAGKTRPPAARARITAVTSGKGGVGKAT